MKKLFLAAIFFSFQLTAHAQFSAIGGYMDMGRNDWEDITIDDFHRGGFIVGIEYWLRLKNYRVEFSPGIFYNQRNEYTVEVADIPDQGDVIYNSNYFSFQFSTSFYPLDFEGDCNCPTFSKQGDFIKKGFFFHIAPEVGMLNGKVNTTTIAGPVEEKISNFYFAVGGGVGLDIGLSDLVTITPLVKVTYFPNVNWDTDFGLSPLDSSSFLAKTFAIRLSFRPDYLRETGRWRR